jgi:hypothetical protein
MLSHLSCGATCHAESPVMRSLMSCGVTCHAEPHVMLSLSKHGPVESYGDGWVAAARSEALYKSRRE